MNPVERLYWQWMKWWFELSKCELCGHESWLRKFYGTCPNCLGWSDLRRHNHKESK